MPGKSRHGKGKSARQRRKERQQYSAAAAPKPAVAQVSQPAPTIAKAALRQSEPKPSAPPVGIQYPYIGAELLRISILTGIILVILIVLSIVLPRA